MPLDDAPERLLDHNLRRTIMLERLADRTASRLAKLIDAVVSDIVLQLREADDLTAAARLRLEAMLVQFAALHRQLADRLSVELDGVLRELTGKEISSQLALLQSADIAVSTQLLTSAQVYAAAMADPIRGKFLREWTASLSEAAQQRLSTALRIGFAEGESLAQIIKRIRGTAAANFTDGLTEIARRDLQTIVRTAMTHFSARAQRAVYEQSPDLLDGYQWISVLDGRTSAICRARSLRVYRKGGPLPPAHANCRSTTIPAIRGMPLPDIPNYGQWLRRQPVGFVEDVLGPTRAKLFRDGKLSIDRFVNLRTGRTYTLDELERRERSAWKRAGL